MEQTVTGEPSGSPLDTERTAKAPTKKPKRKRSAPTWSLAAHPPEKWQEAQEMWLAGESVEAIAQATGIKKGALYARSARYKWPARSKLGARTIIPKAVPPIVEKYVESSVQHYVAKNVPPMIPDLVRQKIEQHFNTTFKLVSTLQNKVEALSMGKLEVEEAKSLSSSVEILDRVARRNLGLDSPGGQAMAAGILCATVAPACPVIDAEIVDQPAQPA